MLALHSIRFYSGRWWATSPLFFVTLSIFSALLATTILAYLSGHISVNESPAPPAADLNHRPAPVSMKTVALDLPAFHTVPVVDAIKLASDRAKVEIGEVTFALEDTPIPVVLRYRTSFTVIGRYRAIRDFVRQVDTQVRNGSVDGVKCLREDIGVAELGCTITMSAFYRRAGHG